MQKCLPLCTCYRGLSGDGSRKPNFWQAPRWFWHTVNVWKATGLEHVIDEVSVEKINVIFLFLPQPGSHFLSLLCELRSMACLLHGHEGLCSKSGLSPFPVFTGQPHPIPRIKFPSICSWLIIPTLVQLQNCTSKSSSAHYACFS